MTAESPARPPPMTIIFGAAIVPLSAFCNLLVIDHGVTGISGLLRAGAERGKAGQSRSSHNKEECQTHDQKPFPRFLSGNYAPLCAEQLDAIREVPRGRDQACNIKQE